VNTKEYIESGILEAYVLGALTPPEQRQVVADVAAYPQLADELRGIEETMFQYARAFAFDPPAGLQEKIWGTLGSANAGSPKIIPLQPDYRKPAMDWKVAATVALLIGSVVLNYVLWSQGRDEKQEKAALNNRMDKLQSEQKQLAASLSDYQKAKNMMADTAMQTIVMHTMQKGHPMAATLYWGKAKGEAYVAMDALPEPPKGMQYQLWVIQNGKPVSMGTLPNNMANTPAMQKVPMQVTSGEAFAISLEKEGGNPTPTTVYVLGKV
jgi:anti-sigma-K factor RskA